MSDDGGRAPEPSDLGSDWVEALLGEPPIRTSAPTTPAADQTSADVEPVELGSVAMVEALLGPAPGAPTPPPEEASPALTPDPPAEAAAPPFAPSPAPSPALSPAPVADPSSGPLMPPLAPPPPTWAGGDTEPTSTWAPEAEPPGTDPVGHEGWTLPSMVAPAAEAPERFDDASSALPYDESGSGDPAGDGWSLSPLVAPPSQAPDAPATDAPADPPSVGLPFLGIKPVAAEPTAKPTKASKRRKAEAARTDALVDPSAPAAVMGAAIGAASAPAGAGPVNPAFLDLRPQADGGAPPSAPGSGSGRSGGRRRRQALVAVAAALVLVAGLVAFQLASDDDGSTDAVLTADAASIEAPDDDESRGISLGVADDEDSDDQVTVEEGSAGGAGASATDAAGEGGAAGDDDTTGSGSGSGGGGPATAGRLAVSASALDFGGGTGEVVSIRNEGGSSISWSASTGGSGFSLASSSSGTLAAGQALNLSVGFSPNGVTEGTAQGTLTIAGGGSRSVSLRASVNRPPAISGVSWVSCGPTSRLRATVTDESGVSQVEVAGTSPAGPGFRKTAVSQGSGAYRADIGPFSSNGQITYFVEATDSRGNVARSTVQYRGWNNGC